METLRCINKIAFVHNRKKSIMGFAFSLFLLNIDFIKEH